MSTIKEKYDLGELITNNLTLKKYSLNQWPDLKNKYVGFNTYLGIEVELEGCREHGNVGYLPNFTETWGITEERSLRPKGEGLEFVSVPLRGLNITAALKHMEHAWEKVYPRSEFSHRCGIHVHINCRNFTTQQVDNIIRTYLCVESVLFDQFVKNDRSGNAFCYPLVESILSCGRRPCKYQALNRQPLSTKGTLEFRHLQGFKDIKYIERWLKYITNLVNFAVKQDYIHLYNQIHELNKLSTYEPFVKNVLGDTGFIKLQETMERDVYAAKRACMRSLV